MTRAPKSKELSARDAFIVEKAKQKFSPTEILVLMQREGFAKVARSRIYQILESNGVRAPERK